MELEKGQAYSQGNLATFNKLLVKLTGKNDPKVCCEVLVDPKVCCEVLVVPGKNSRKTLVSFPSFTEDLKNFQVLYFGDSMRSDIVPAKKYAKWDTVFVYEEMEAEIGHIVNQSPLGKETGTEENDEPAKKKLKTDTATEKVTKGLQVTTKLDHPCLYLVLSLSVYSVIACDILCYPTTTEHFFVFTHMLSLHTHVAVDFARIIWSFSHCIDGLPQVMTGILVVEHVPQISGCNTSRT